MNTVRRFEFAVDREHARAVNEVVADTRRLRLGAFIAAAMLGLCTAGLIRLDHPYLFLLAVAFGLGTVTALFVALWTPRRARIEMLYAEGELVPAVVVDRHPGRAVLLVLVDVAKAGADPHYALITRKARSLPGYRIWPGERVPYADAKRLLLDPDQLPSELGGAAAR
jgi:hypothetical protein